MREQREWAPCHPLLEKCLGVFADTAIADAKVYLLDNVKEELKTINEELAQDVAKSRKKSNNRSIAYAQAVDIYDILDAFGTKIKVCPNNIKNIPRINPEALLPSAILQRIVVLETKNKALVEVGDTLKEQMAKLTTSSPALPTGETKKQTPNVSETPKQVRLTNAQKIQVSAIANNEAAAAAAKAAKDGKSVKDARESGVIAGNAAAKTYAMFVKSGGGSNAMPAADAASGSSPSNTRQTVGKNKNNKSKLSMKFPYTTGSGASMSVDNKTLTS